MGFHHTSALVAVLLLGAASLTACSGPGDPPVASPGDGDASGQTPAEPVAPTSEVPADAALPGEPFTGPLQSTGSGLRYVILSPGTGPVPPPNSGVLVHYTGYFLDGNIFDSSVQRGVPLEFVLGQGAVIRGWDEAVAQMQMGERRKLVVPPELGYGAQGHPAGIPGGATLVFDVELVGIP